MEFAVKIFTNIVSLEFNPSTPERRKTMSLVLALLIIPALAAFSFQLICYANYRNSAPSSLKWQQRTALQNA